MSADNDSSMGENLAKRMTYGFSGPLSIDLSKKQSENNDPICESSHNYQLAANNQLNILRRESPQTIPVIFLDGNHLKTNSDKES